MPAVPINQIFGWNTNVTYSKWDPTTVQYPGLLQYFFSTKDSNQGNNPTATYSFTPTHSTRTDNVTRISFPQGASPLFTQGSVIAVANVVPDSSINFTGLILAGGSLAGNSGYCDYMNPGLNTANAITAGSVTAPIHPAWTTGMMWLPSWQTEVTNNQQVIDTKLGEGYSSRFNPVINSNSLSWNLVFAERSDREAGGLLTFLQVQGGATPFYINYPVGTLYPAANLKYIGGPPRNQLTSYGLNTVTFTATQVFDI